MHAQHAAGRAPDVNAAGELLQFDFDITSTLAGGASQSSLSLSLSVLSVLSVLSLSLSLSLALWPSQTAVRVCVCDAAAKQLFPDAAFTDDYSLPPLTGPRISVRPYVRTSEPYYDLHRHPQAERIRRFVADNPAALSLGREVDYSLTNGKSRLLPLARRGLEDIRVGDVLIAADVDRLALSAADATLLMARNVRVVIVTLGLRPLNLSGRSTRAMWSTHALFASYNGVVRNYHR